MAKNASLSLGVGSTAMLKSTDHQQTPIRIGHHKDSFVRISIVDKESALRQTHPKGPPASSLAAVHVSWSAPSLSTSAMLRVGRPRTRDGAPAQ